MRLPLDGDLCHSRHGMTCRNQFNLDANENVWSTKMHVELWMWTWTCPGHALPHPFMPLERPHDLTFGFHNAIPMSVTQLRASTFPTAMTR